MRQISTSKGWLLDRSVEAGSRPSLMEMFLSALANLPLGEAQGSSGMSLVLILCIRNTRDIPEEPLGEAQGSSGMSLVLILCIRNVPARPSGTAGRGGSEI